MSDRNPVFNITPFAVIVESTYGTNNHLPREQREGLFLQRVTDTLRAGGRVLLPVVAMGRAQELLLLLDEHWAAHPELHGVPIYQVSKGFDLPSLTCTPLNPLTSFRLDTFQPHSRASCNLPCMPSSAPHAGVRPDAVRHARV